MGHHRRHTRPLVSSAIVQAVCESAQWLHMVEAVCRFLVSQKLSICWKQTESIFAPQDVHCELIKASQTWKN